MTFKPASAPAAVSAANGTILVGDNFFHEAGQPIEDNVVEINGGERVTFTQMEEGARRGGEFLSHNVVFTDSQPNSCIQTAGDPIDQNTTAPLPDYAMTQWSGYCTFQTGGTYDFYCSAHPDMTGQVIVNGNGTPTPTPTVTVTPTVTPTVTVTPTTTPTGRPHIIAKDGGAQPYWFQDASSTDVSDNSVTIPAGGTVDFSYPTGPQVHNVEFRRNLSTPSSNGPQPTCVQTSGINTGAVPPLPRNSVPAGWAGNCTFTEPGVYTFVCAAHAPLMQGSVVVESTAPTPPETTIDSGPAGPTNQTSASFGFSSNQAAATFECKLDTPAGPGTYAACTSPAAFTTTTNGSYTFTVRAVLAGTPDPTPATRSFTVDTAPPDTSINSGPTGTVNTTSQSFQFSGTEVGSTFECRLDTPAGNGTFSTCTSPQAYTTTANGAYTFHVRARDALGNVDPSPATRSFTVDTVAPDTTITGGPTGTTNNASPEFTFTSTETGSTFECRLDGPGATTGTYVSCTSPRTVGPLADGTYTFNVRARDAAGNQDATAATRSFTVATTAPDTTITGGPTGLTNGTSPSFTFTSTQPGSTFECRLDTPAGNGTFAACTSPQAYTTTANGAYTFHVRAIAAGVPDPTAATRSFTVDTTAPNTTIDSGPTGTITTNSPQFTFSSSETGSTFECRLDTGASQGTWQTCTSPRILGSLADGAYTFNVRATDGAGNVDATPATRTFTVDATAPNTTIDSGPTGTITTASPQFTFSSSEAGSTFECRLDGPGSATGTYAACPSPRTLGPLADGAYTFLVRAIDGAGNPDATAASRAFTVDATAPDTSITSGPTGTITTSSASFAFTSPDGGATFECRLDNAAFAACTSPQAYTSLAEGAHTFEVRARDAAGNVDPSPATRTFTVDTVAPDTSIASGPTGTINTSSASFGFTSPDAGATFECRLDGAAFAACTSPQAYTNLAEGEHTFAVRAKDAAGNVDASPATRTFTVDTAAPDTTINGGPTGPINTTSVSFPFSSTEAGATFECRLDGAAFAACTSPQAYTSLAQGEHTFAVRARDAAGNVDPTPATRTFTVDTAAPNTTIDSGPTGTINTASPEFGFSSSETGSTFECRLDGPGATTGTYVSCTSPRTVGPLVDGTYTFLVRAIDAAGNVDATPASRTFTVETSFPDTAITGGPTGPTNNASPSFTFTSTKAGSTFECRLDSAAFAACTSPQAYTNLAAGEHTFAVRARDAAGNLDPTPATRTFTVDTTAPNTTIDSGPTGTITTNSATFGFSSSESGSTFECRLDGPGSAVGTYGACTSPRILGSLADGTYTFLVRAIDAAGNVDATPASRTFSVDTVAPNTTIDSGPTGTIGVTTAAFTFSSSEAGSTFECRLDTGAFELCTSPKTYTGLAAGEHTFAVRAIDAAGNVDASPATRTFTVDTAAPDTTITGGPTGTTSTTSASFTFTSTKAGSTFECRLDTPAGNGTFAACTSPQAYTTTANGAYTFHVRATDAAGNVDPSPATRTFTVDTVAPNTTIDSGPTGTVGSTSATFTFSSSESGSTFECRLDTGAFEACTSPKAYTGLSAGEHTFAVRAIDAAGNVDASPATRTFTVDTVAPDTSITGGPTGVTNNASPSFTFTSTKAGSTFECRLDTGAFEACTSPKAYTNLAAGEHTFAVRATDAAGNVDPSPATRTFTVDTTAPNTTIDSGPTGTIGVTSATFTFSSSETGSTFECRLDSAAFAACTSPQAYTNLTQGEHTFAVRAIDAAGNVDASPATRTFTVDTAAPDTTITGGPTGTTNNASPSFTFTSTKPNSTFECRLDTGAFEACTSPKAYTNLAAGEHTFAVRATDAAGNVDPSPATRTFTVDTVAPNTTIDSGPTGTIGVTSATFTFSSSETGSTFECRLDSTAFAACTSPQAYTNLTQGEHTFAVRAIDAAGNVDASPATRTFTVDTAAPDTTITGGPTGTTNNASPSFTFTSTKPNSTFECRLDTGAFEACTSPKAYTGLAQGEHTFTVRATDSTGTVDPTPASRTFTVDTAAPDTTITGGPTGTITATTQTFTFTSPEAGATFECRLDTPAGQGAYGACSSPHQTNANTLGDYTFWVRAKDAAGNVDATPASRTFRVEPDVTPPTEVHEDGVVSGTVPTVLALTLDGSAAFPPFIPGVGAEYQASLTARVTTSTATAELSVVDQSATNPGRMVNDTYVLTNALEARAINATQTNPPFASISGNPLRLLTYPTYIASDPVTIGLRQIVRSTEPLRAGAYEKTLTFTLSTTQP